MNAEIDRAINDLLGIQRQDQPLHQMAMFEECWRAIEAAGIERMDVIVINTSAEQPVAYNPPAKLPEQIYGQIGELTLITMAQHAWEEMNVHATWSTGINLGDMGRAILISEVNDPENGMMYDQYGNHYEPTKE